MESLADAALRPGEWDFVASPREGRPPSMSAPPDLLEDESRAQHCREKMRNSAAEDQISGSKLTLFDLGNTT